LEPAVPQPNPAHASVDFWASKKRLERARGIFALTVIVVLSLLMVVPLAWMIAIALKRPENVFQLPPWKVDWQWGNFAAAWYPYGHPSLDGGLLERLHSLLFARESFWWYLWNSVVVTSLSVLGMVLSAAMVAFAFARLRFPGRDPLFVLVIATMMVPSQVTMIPTYILFAKIGWTNSWLPLIVPAWLGGGAFNIFLLRQFFMGIPHDLDEAAKIDGCSTFGIFWRIMLPLSLPSLVTVAVFGVVWTWNDFLGPLIYVQDPEKFTLALGLNAFRSLAGDKTNLMMAAASVVLLPVLLLFLFGQRYFIQGVATTGLKG
jgi:multiple sugar transport system permease protein